MTTINNFVGAIGGSPWWSILYQYTINNQPIQQLRIANSILVSPNANNGYWFGNKLNYSSNSASQVSPAQVISNVILDQVRTNPSTTWQPVWIDAIQYFNPVCLNRSCGFSNGYLLLTSDEVSVSDIGSLGSNLATSLYGYVSELFRSTGGVCFKLTP